MSKFGFKIEKDRQIDYDKADLRVAHYVEEHEPSFRTCIDCGACAATCNAGHFTSFNVHRVNVMVKRGLLKGLRQEMDKCMYCGKCQLVCPRNISNRHVILLVKEALTKIEHHEL